MTAALAVARAGWRRQRRAWLSLVIVAAFGLGAAMTAVVGARRTDTAYTRFVTAQRGADIVVEPNFGEDFATLSFDDVRRLPQVAVAGRTVGVATESGLALGAPIPPTGVGVDRPKVLHGRLPSAIGEAAVGFDMARERHLHVGSRLDLAVIPPVDAGDTESIRPTPMTIRVVGIVAAPGEFPPQLSGNHTFIRVTPETIDSLRGATTVLTETVVRLRGGAADVPAFTVGLQALAGAKPQTNTIRGDQAANVQRSLHLQAVALWLVAGLLGVVTAAVVTQLLARQSAIDAVDYATFKALGAARAPLWWAGLVRAAAAGLVAAAGGASAAIVASPLTPIGTARLAEPHPGVVFDASVIGAGVLLSVVFFVAAAAVPLWRAASVPAMWTPTAADQTGRSSTVTNAVSVLGLPPAADAGVRMALQRGRGRTAVPVLSSLMSVAVAIGALAAALTFGANLSHLLSTPRLYGWNWDAHLTSNTGRADAALLVEAVGDDPQVEAMAEFDTPPLGSGSVTFDSLTMRQVKGNVEPILLEGRTPRAANEIALGTDTMRRLHTHVGATIDVRVTVVDSPPQPVRVVGRIVVASQSDAGRLGTGAFLDFSAEPYLVTPDVEIPPPSEVAVRFAPGADKRQALAELRRRLGPQFSALEPQRPADLVNFGHVQNLPFLLGALVGALGAATLAHALVTSIRRRRRDLSVLMTLGLSSRQVRAAVATQATVFVIAAAVVGLPLGMAAGRMAWLMLAERLGIVPNAVTPSVTLAATIAVAAVVANLIAIVPGAIAGRLRPALILRSE